jgi:hypothetical protein
MAKQSKQASRQAEPQPQPQPQPIQAGNIALDRRPVVLMQDGSFATVRSMGIGMEVEDGKQVEVLIPTIGPQGEDWSPQQAIQAFRETGQHLGVFGSSEEAARYAEKLHKDQEKMYKDKAAQARLVKQMEELSKKR